MFSFSTLRIFYVKMATYEWQGEGVYIFSWETTELKMIDSKSKSFSEISYLELKN